MPNGLGFRVEGVSVHWAAITTKDGVVVIDEVNTCKAPKAYGEAQMLSWIRGRVALLIETHSPIAAGVKYGEAISRGSSTSIQKRARVEGVILQLLDERSIASLGCAYTSIGGKLELGKPKEYLQKDEFRGADWSEYKVVHRDAILAALAALEE